MNFLGKIKTNICNFSRVTYTRYIINAQSFLIDSKYTHKTRFNITIFRITINIIILNNTPFKVSYDSRVLDVYY